MIKNLYARLVLWLTNSASPHRETFSATASAAPSATDTVHDVQTNPPDEKAISVHRDDHGNVLFAIGRQVSPRVLVLFEPLPGVATYGWEIVRGEVRNFEVTSLLRLSMCNGLRALQSPVGPPMSLTDSSPQK